LSEGLTGSIWCGTGGWKKRKGMGGEKFSLEGDLWSQMGKAETTHWNAKETTKRKKNR